MGAGGGGACHRQRCCGRSPDGRANGWCEDRARATGSRRQGQQAKHANYIHKGLRWETAEGALTAVVAVV